MGAATALLAKAHAYRGNWQACHDLCMEIISSQEYFLDPTTRTFSPKQAKRSGFDLGDSVHECFRWQLGQPLEGTFTNVWQRARGQFGGYGFNIPEQNFVDEFENGDPRMAATVFQEGDQMGDRGTFTLDATGMPHLYYPKKYFINASDEAPFGDPNPNGYSNDRVIRYADVLLFGAESAYYVGDEALARQLTNIVRARARNNNSSILLNLSKPHGASAVGCHSARTPRGIGLGRSPLLRLGSSGTCSRGAG